MFAYLNNNNNNNNNTCNNNNNHNVHNNNNNLIETYFIAWIEHKVSNLRGPLLMTYNKMIFVHCF